MAPQRTFFRNTLVAIGPRAIKWLIFGVIGSVVLSSVELAVSLFIQMFLRGLGVLSVDLHLPEWFSRANPTPVDLAIMLTLIAMVRGLVKYVVSHSGNVSMEMINARLRRFALYEMLLHPDERVVSASKANIRINELSGKAAWFVAAFVDLLANAVQAAGLLVAMFLAAWRETMVALVGLFVLGLFVLALNRKNRIISERVPHQLELLVGGIERIARNTTLVRALRTQNEEHARLAANIDACATYTIAASGLGAMVGALVPFIGTLLIVVIIVVSQMLFHTAGLVLVSFLYLFFRFTQCVAASAGQSSFCTQRWPQFSESIRYTGTFTDAEVEEATHDHSRDKVIPWSDRRTDPPAVSARGLGFTYPETERAIFDKLDLEVSPGQQLAIVGTSGSGKSTLLGLILGLFQPSSGALNVGGLLPKAYFAERDVRVGYVGAEAFLLAGSVRDNLLYGARATFTDQQLWEALDKARLRREIDSLPGKLDYAITEEGAGLSAGQKQRLCLARALLCEPQLLILDEASANLDEATELEIADTLGALRGQCTTIVVSHRPGIIKFADRVVRMGEF